MMAIAIDRGANLSVLLPTARYVGRDDDLRADIQDFMQDLLGGYYGALPDQMILEIGNEYYASFDSNTADGAAADYAAIADIMITEISLALADSSINTTGADLLIAVQSGKTSADDQDIRDGLSDFSLSNADMIIQHRFPADADQVDARIIVVQDIVDAWQQDLEDLGAEAPELFLSEWNVAHLTRDEVLADFLQEPATQQQGLTAADIDLAGRTNATFEQYWQDALSQHSYGDQHPGVLLELFASYTEAAMSAGGVYGIDTLHAGRLSWFGDDGENHTFVGGEMLKMLYESVDDTYLVDSGVDYSSDNLLTPYIFENDDKLVIFLAAGENGAGEYTLDVSGMGDVYDSVWAERLGAEIMPDWMTAFGIVDNPLVDETPEAETYSAPVREAINPQFTESGLVVNIFAPNEIVRLAFAKTDAGAQEIASWSQALGLVPLPLIVDQSWDAGDLADADDEDPIEFDDMGMGFGALLLILLAFL